jgi:hypothetical protein
MHYIKLSKKIVSKCEVKVGCYPCPSSIYSTCVGMEVVVPSDRGHSLSPHPPPPPLKKRAGLRRPHTVVMPDAIPIFVKFLWPVNFNLLKLLYLKMFLDGCIDNFWKFMFNKKFMSFSPQIGEQSRALRRGALISAEQSTVEIKVEHNE